MTQLEAIKKLIPLVGDKVKLTFADNSEIVGQLYKVSFARLDESCGAHIICDDGYSAVIAYKRIKKVSVFTGILTQVYP